MIRTLNAAIARIKKICESHRQVRSFFLGAQSDWITDKKKNYPSILLEYAGGSLGLNTKQVTIGFSMILADLQNLAFKSDQNLLDVQSDMLSVAQDLMAQFNDPRLDDWVISIDNTVELFSQKEGDYLAGVILTFSVSLIYTQNLCAVPTDLIQNLPVDGTPVFAYDEIYRATGTEGNQITLSDIDLTKILLVTREGAVIYPSLSEIPDPAEYTVSGNTIIFGTPLSAKERILILYRVIP